MRYCFWLLFGVVMLTPVFAQTDIPTLTYDNRERTYYLHVPPDLPSDTSVPLVIALHGAGGSGVEFFFSTQLHQLADETGVIVAYPNGIREGWNYLDADELHPADLYTDDMGLVAALIDEISANYPIDSKRVYVLGYSNGGMLAIRAMCEHSARLAGVIVMAATFEHRLAQHCQTARPTSFLLVLGTEDQAFPWTGFAILTDDRRFRSSFSARQTMQYMASLNQCEGQSVAERLDVEGSPVGVIQDMFVTCANNTQLALMALVDAGHTWPFQPRVRLASGEVGNVEAVVWEWMLAQSR